MKRTKLEEQEIKSELTVLNRTEQILQNRCENLNEALKKMEKAQGVAGYMDTQQELENWNSKERIYKKMSKSMRFRLAIYSAGALQPTPGRPLLDHRLGA